jgi:hypothetical protein
MQFREKNMLFRDGTHSSLTFLAAALAAAILLAVPVDCTFAGPASKPASLPSDAAHVAELRAEVPELTAFHEVIFELWHKAWPEKNITLIKELLPRVKTDFGAVEKAAIPGILRDKEASWKKGLKRMNAMVDACDNAAAANDVPGLLAAVEALHSGFEAQMRIVRPVMKELGDFHVDLYQIYHHFLPGKQIEQLRASASTMKKSCQKLAEAAPPRWFKSDIEVLSKEREALCQETADLDKALGSADWEVITKAVEAVHNRYLSVESLFK